MARWAEGDELLRGFRDLHDVLRYVRGKSNIDDTDAVLLCLARRAPDEPLATRCLLQCVIPGLLNVARQYRDAGVSDEELAAMVVAAGYERIRRYPMEQRPQKVSANVVLDARQRVSRALFRNRVDEVLVSEPRVAVGAAVVPERSASDELIEVLKDARARGKISKADLALIGATRLGGQEIPEIAHRYAVHPDRLYKRRYRAEVALASCVGASRAGANPFRHGNAAKTDPGVDGAAHPASAAD